MSMSRIAVGFAVIALGACASDPLSESAAREQALPSLAAGDHGVVARLTGAGHHVRVLGGVEDLTTFSFSAIRRADGTTTGQYQYNFRAAGFSVHGPVTCLSIRGNEAWVGGTVGRIDSPDAEDQALVGVDMWWRVQDGAGIDGGDLSSGVGFAFAGSAITAASWCADQPALLPVRPVAHGNLTISGS
jgi:hypothetical protein